MRKAVFLVFVFALVVAIPAALFAQNGDLTAERRAELQKQLSDLERQMAQTQKMNADRNTAIKALLTDEQKKKFDENVAAMPQGRGRGGL